MNPELVDIARTIAAAGGRALIVGGYVRDRLLGISAKDIDVEVYGLDITALEDLLSRYGAIYTAGRAFGVLRIKSLDVDFSLPRRDSKVAPGHRGFEVRCDPELDFATAARRRDFTVNSMGFDPLTEEILDPHGGAFDLQAGRLRVTDPNHFCEDPLRALRAAQFSARFRLQPDVTLYRLCAAMDLSELPPARIGEEFRKLLLLSEHPSSGLAFMAKAQLLRFFPELDALRGVPQDRKWHPEGDVWIHTLLVVDEAARLRTSDIEYNVSLMFGALCHDFGKPDTTVIVEGRVRSPGHDEAGIAPTFSFLERLNVPQRNQKQIAALVRHHLAPALFVQQGTGAKGYRRLARKLDAASVSTELLLAVARADHLGRTTLEAKAKKVPAEMCFQKAMQDYLVAGKAAQRVVTGRYLMERGFEPGPQLGQKLAVCELIQDETGWTDPQQIVAAMEQRITAQELDSQSSVLAH